MFMSSEYLYVQIYNKLLEEIKAHHYKPGDRLPTEKELSELYNVSRITSQKAMNMLVDEGIVTRYPGIGSFVAGETVVENSEEQTTGKRKSGRKIIGLILEAMWQSFGIGMFDGVYEKARALGYDLVIKKSYGNQKEEMRVIDELVEMGAEGIIIMPVHGAYYSEEILKLVVNKFPIVFVDRYLNGIHVPFVGSNNIEGSKMAVRYLAELGHKHIALVTTKEHEATTLDERKQGYIEGSIECKTNIAIYDKAKCIIPHTYCQSDTDVTVEEIKKFLRENDEVTALLATEYYSGTLAKKAAVSIGKKVPQDISVICFDAPLEYLGEYEFTHIRQGEEAIGNGAVELLDRLISGEEVNDKLLIETTIVQGYSTGIAKKR